MSFIGLLNQTITLRRKSGYDGYGRESMGSATTYRCRFQQTNRTILLATGDSIILDGYIDVLGTCPVQNNDRITYNGEDYRVINRKEAIGRNGNLHHITLGVKLWQS